MHFLLPLIFVWLVLIAARFRTALPVLVGGLVAVAMAALTLIAHGDLAPANLGLVAPRAWPLALALSVGWTALMLLLTPVADRIATAVFAKPPNLGIFRGIQESRLQLVAGIVFAWVAGGFLEELALRGIVLNGVVGLLSHALPYLVALAHGVLIAAAGAFILHLYQGLRAAFIVAQLSVLFGVLYGLAGHSLWPVVLTHGLYDTVAFIRFAARSSKYSHS